jgi:hypothetical protein
MPTQLLAKLIDVAYNEVQPDISQYEIENQLLDNLLGKSLSFSTKKGTRATIRFHNIGNGKNTPSTTVTLQVKGVEFIQEPERLTLDLRYIFYKEYGHDFLFRQDSIKFLVQSPFIQKLGPENVLIKCAVYGNTVGHINRSLSIFADLIRLHQDQRHQTAIDWYDNRKEDWDGDQEIELEKPIKEVDPIDKPIEALSEFISEEAYIEEYIQYIDNPYGDTRELIDNRNTYAQSQL